MEDTPCLLLKSTHHSSRKQQLTYILPAVLYLVGEEIESDSFSSISGVSIGHRTCFLEGTLGIPTTHPAVPLRLDLRKSAEGFAPAFREALKSGTPVALHTAMGTLPESLLEGIEWRGFGEPCKSAVVYGRVFYIVFILFSYCFHIPFDLN